MLWLARLLGAAVGFAVGILLVEVVFPNGASWPDVVPFALGVTGWLVGGTAGHRRARAPRAPASPQ